MKTIKQLILILFLIAVVVNTSCTRKQTSVSQPCRFVLHGKVADSLNGKRVKLITYCYYPKSKIYKTYATTVRGDRFTLTGMIDMPCAMANLLIFDTKGDITGNKKIVLEAKDNQLVTPEAGPNDKFPNNNLSRAMVINSKANYIKHLVDSVESSAGNTSSAADYFKTVDEKVNVLAH